MGASEILIAFRHRHGFSDGQVLSVLAAWLDEKGDAVVERALAKGYELVTGEPIDR